MKRKIIKIEEEKCNGCGLCIPNCMEGALQMIDGKARLISDLFCDGLGACIGFCPEGAITIEEREAAPYNEMVVMETISAQGENTIIAHLDHLLEHGEVAFLDQALIFMEKKNIKLNVEKYTSSIPGRIEQQSIKVSQPSAEFACGCAGTLPTTFPDDIRVMETLADYAPDSSELQQWPVQLHLLNPMASFFHRSDLILTADCVAFAAGNFHSKYLKGKKLAIACPKLDRDIEKYIDKLTLIVKNANLNSFSVLRMEVPCCGGLTQMARIAREKADIDIPIREIIIGTKGEYMETTTI